MNDGLAPPASAVPRLMRERPQRRAGAEAWLRGLCQSRRHFGITRVGSITGLDRIGIPVVQAVRPLALTNAVSQGKGLTFASAAISALMEAIEGYAAENIPAHTVRQAPCRALGARTADLYRGFAVAEAPAEWERIPLDWIDGWDLSSGAVIPVPLALVDTVYTLPSPHPRLFPRTTTGLAAGSSFVQAVVHAGLEILERDAIAAARAVDGFFERWRTETRAPAGSVLGEALERVREAGLVCGFWQAPAAHRLPVYWCHVMEGEDSPELAPLPSEGFGCDVTHEAAALKALLEACQGRATAISGAREDITHLHYPGWHDRRHLAEWREELATPRLRRIAPVADEGAAEETSVHEVLAALKQAGAAAAIVVPLFSDEARGIHVARVVAPPLRPDPEA